MKTIGLLNVDNPYGQEGRASVIAEAKKDRIKVVATQQFGQDDKDMSVQAQKLTAQHPDAVVAWAVSPGAGIVAKNLKDAGFKGGLYLDAGDGPNCSYKARRAPQKALTWSSPGCSPSTT